MLFTVEVIARLHSYSANLVLSEFVLTTPSVDLGFTSWLTDFVPHSLAHFSCLLPFVSQEFT
jgi:hypothetical protein